jgi:ABC-type transport system substrate-binding protein
MTTSRRERRFLLPLLVLFAGFGDVASPALPPAQSAAVPRYNGTFRIKGNWLPFNQVFDPARPSHYFITEQLFDGLVRFDAHYNPMPALAEYWKISDGGSRITFKLRKGVRFHNGRELTAEDVKYSLERLVKKRPDNTFYQNFTRKVAGAEAYWQGQADEVSGFRVVDPGTFEILWTRPFGSVGLYLLGMHYCKILPKDLLESQGRNFFHKPVGTGPFKFDEWIRSPRLEILGVRLERNAAYYGDRKPYVSAIEYSPHFTDDQFEEGSVHLVTVTSERLLRRRYPILESDTLRTYFLALSCDIPPLDRPEVRKALSLGLDKAGLAGAYDTPSNVHLPLENFIPPLLPGFFPRAGGPAADPAAAKLLLDRLLAGSGPEGLVLELVFATPRTDATARFARELERQLAALGIGLGVKYLRKPEDVLGIRTPYLSFLDYSMDFPDPENIVVPLFHSRSVVNGHNSRYANARLDGLLELCEVEPSWEKRADLFRKAEQLLFQETPAIPLFSERVRIALRPEVRGVKVPAMGFISLDVKAIWLED